MRLLPLLLVLVLISSVQGKDAPTTQAAESRAARERWVAGLKEMRQRCQARVDELKRELRDQSNHLNLDGLGAPGKLSAREAELQDLLAAQADMARNTSDAREAYEEAMAAVKEGKDLPVIEQMIKRDPQIQAARKALSEAEEAKHNNTRLLEPPEKVGEKRISVAQKRLDDVVAEVRAKETSRIIDALRTQSDQTAAALKGIGEKVDTAKAGIAEVMNEMKRYLATYEDDRAARELLQKIDEEIGRNKD